MTTDDSTGETTPYPTGSGALDSVADAEELYRAVLNDPDRFFPRDAQGNRRISSMAFNDAGRRPSVDRAVLCPSGPQETRERFSPAASFP